MCGHKQEISRVHIVSFDRKKRCVFVWTDTTSKMPAQIGLKRKAWWTCWTLMCLNVHVFVHVVVIALFPGKSLLAEVTQKGVLLQVNPVSVFSESTSWGKSGITKFTKQNLGICFASRSWASANQCVTLQGDPLFHIHRDPRWSITA